MAHVFQCTRNLRTFEFERIQPRDMQIYTLTHVEACFGLRQIDELIKIYIQGAINLRK